MTGRRRIAVLAGVALCALGLGVGAATAKMPQLRFEPRQAAAGTRVTATVRLWAPLSVASLRFFLIHQRDLAAMFHPEEWMLFRAQARAAARDPRFVELDVAPTDHRGNSVTVAVPLSKALRPGLYTTAVYRCDPSCVFELALSSRRVTILRSLSPWNQRFALRITRRASP